MTREYQELSEDDILLQFSIDLDEDLKMSLNKIWWGVHWWVRSTFRNIWHEEIYALVKKEEIQPINQMIHIEYVYKFKTRYLDTSNCSVMNKAIEDWLVEAEVLKDDTPQYITSATTCVPVVEPNDRRKMKYDNLTVTLYKVWMSPHLRWEVIRERAKGSKRTSRWGKSTNTNWEVVKDLAHMK